MPEELAATPVRLGMLAAILDGRVSWDPPTARYMLDGQATTGPQHKTLSTMARHGWIIRAQTVVKVTSAGVAVMT